MFSGDSTHDVLRQHVNAVPVPPSIHSPFPAAAALDDVILDCLAKHVERRPADALDVARRLTACDVGEPWTEDCAARWWREHLPKAEPAAVGMATGSDVVPWV